MIRGYNDKEVLSFTGHIHPQAPQHDNLYVYSGNLKKDNSKDAGPDISKHEVDVDGKVEGTVLYSSHLPLKKFDKSCLFYHKFTSFHIFFLLIPGTQCNYKCL